MAVGRHQGGHGPLPPDGPSAGTAYALRVRDTLLVTVDEFYKRPHSVQLTLDPAQQRWLGNVLAAARSRGTEHIIVQGHLPVLGTTGDPIPSVGSSRLFLTGGATSPFWRLPRKYHVDVYLAGEMHAVSMRANGGVAQLVHGAIPALGLENYVVGDVYPNRIVLTVKALTGSVLGDHKLWQLTGGLPNSNPAFTPGAHIVATYTVPRAA